MKIEKVINNNIVSAFDAAGSEVVVMGRGIGFGKKPGTVIDDSRIEKVFRLENSRLVGQFTELLEKIPAEQVEVADEIITHAAKQLTVRLSPVLYVTLTDHVSFAIERNRQNIPLENALLFEIRSFYSQEFLIGKFAVDLINRRFGTTLGDDEAGFIALHFVNAEYGTDINQAMKFPRQMKEIIRIVEKEMNLSFDESSLAFERFATHIKFLLQRVYRHETTPGNMPEIYESIRRSCPEEYRVSRRIAEYIEKTSGTGISDGEILYLTIHIRRASGESTKEKAHV